MRLVLASGSRCRYDMLQQWGFLPDIVHAADIDETPLKNEKPHIYVKRLAMEKAKHVAALYPDAYIVAADTTAFCAAKIIGKPADENDARRILKTLSGRRHRVFTGVCVHVPDGRIAARVAETTLSFKRLEPYEIDDYMTSGEWQGKAGGYAIQGRAAPFVQWMNGSATNVMGLPAYETLCLLRGLGYIKN